MPVSVRYAGLDRWESTGLDIAEYTNSFHRFKEKLFASRRFEVPDWAVDNEKTATVIVSYLEARMQSFGRPNKAKNRTLKERLILAEAALRTRVPNILRELDMLCKEFVELKSSATPDADRMKQLSRLIRNADSQLRFCERPAAVVASVVFRYFRLGENSVAVAQALDLQPPAVRQIVRRLWRTAVSIGFEPPVRCQVRKVTAPKIYQSAGAQRRWARPGERERMSQLVKAGLAKRRSATASARA